MLITFSGYNATGKTTAIEAVRSRLRRHQVPHQVIRFFSLDVFSFARPRPKSPGRLGPKAAITIRASERQPGAVNKPFRWFHFGKTMLIALRVVWIMQRNPHKAVLCSQYFFDSYAFSSPTGFWYRMAVRLTPQPSIAFMLSTDAAEHEKRFVERLEQRHDRAPETLSERDRADLAASRKRYEAIAVSFPYIQVVDSTSYECHEVLWSTVRDALGERLGSVETDGDSRGRVG